MIRISDEELIESVRQKAAELGRTPAAKEFRQFATAAIRFGSWSNFIQASGLEVKRKHISNQELMSLLYQRSAELGHTPTALEFKQFTTASKRYGSWNNFLIAAGVAPNRINRRPVEKLTKSELLEAVLQLSKKLGETPRATDFPYYRAAAKQFGSWTKFIEASGLEKRVNQRFSREELIQALQAKAAETGQTPLMQEIKCSHQAIELFGSWSKFVQASGLESRRIQRSTNERLFELFLQTADKLGRTPAAEEFEGHKTAIKRFETWDNFIEAANQHASKMNMTDEELIQSFIQMSEELGETPRAADFQHYHKALQQFGSWANFIKATGLPERKGGISDEELIHSLQQRATELGYTPIAREFEYSKLARSRYGSWLNFIKEAGLTPNGKSYGFHRDKQMLMDELLQLRDILGKTPRATEFKHHRDVKKHYGTWENFIEVSGLPKRSRKRISDRELVGSLQQQVAKLGYVPNSEDFPSHFVACERFGSWNNFVRAAGLTPNQKDPAAKLTKEELITKVLELKEELGRVPRTFDFEYSGQVPRKFGSWNNFIKAAGLPVYTPRKTPELSKEELIEHIRALSKEMGETPRCSDFMYYQQARVQFGSWENFIEESGLKKRSWARIPTKVFIQSVQQKAVELGRIPTSREFPDFHEVMQRYKSWGSFLDAAGLTPQKKVQEPNIFKQRLIREFVALSEEMGETPRMHDFADKSKAIQQFGSWSNFIKATGLQSRKRGYSREELIQAVREKAAKLGRVPTIDEFILSDYAMLRFKSWKLFLEQAGLKSE